MGLDLWFREDVARILAATHTAMAASLRAAPAVDREAAEAYRQGFEDALRAVGVAFGVAVPEGGGPGLGRSAPGRWIVDGEVAQLPGRTWNSNGRR
jgi:hypothetical protein